MNDSYGETPTVPQESNVIDYGTPDNTILYVLPKLPGAGPDCIWDNGPTQKNGTCYICMLCGSTSACG